MHGTNERADGTRESLLLTLTEAARELRVCSKTVRNLSDRGHFPLLKLDGSTRVRRTDLEAYLDRVAGGAVDGGRA